MSQKEELHKLFEEWKEEQKKDDTDTIQIQVQIKRVEKDSFSYDGFVNSEKPGTVLYILAEPNLQENIKIGNNEFWFKDIYQDKSNKNIIKTRINDMQKCINKIRNDIELTDISYMNINKRGGYAPCNWEVVKRYYNKYKEKYIYKEIEILDPKIIIFCAGTQLKEIYEDIKSKFSNKPTIFVSHLSRICSNDKYIEEFEKKVDTLLHNKNND